MFIPLLCWIDKKTAITYDEEIVMLLNLLITIFPQRISNKDQKQMCTLTWRLSLRIYHIKYIYLSIYLSIEIFLDLSLYRGVWYEYYVSITSKTTRKYYHLLGYHLWLKYMYLIYFLHKIGMLGNRLFWVNYLYFEQLLKDILDNKYWTLVI